VIHLVYYLLEPADVLTEARPLVMITEPNDLPPKN
jgi:hypothetical protein